MFHFINARRIVTLAMIGAAFFLSSCQRPGAESAEQLDDKNSVDRHLFDELHVLCSGDWLLPNGAKLWVEETRTIADASVNIQIRDQVARGVMTREYEHAYLCRFINETHVRVEFQTDEVSSQAIISGKPSPQPDQEGALHEQVILFARSGDGWQGELEAEQATPDQVSRIDIIADELNAYNDMLILGGAPREVGETWEIDPSKLNSYAGALKQMEGTFKVFFKTIVKYQGYHCAEIELAFNLAGVDPDGMEMRLAGKSVVLHSLDYQIPLSMEMMGEVTMVDTIQNGLGKMRTKGPIKIKRESTLTLP